MTEIDQERKKILQLRKAIVAMQDALDDAIGYLNEREEELFNDYELNMIRRPNGLR